MIPPGLWAAFSMMGRVLSCLSDVMRTGMCLICALFIANNWKRSHTNANKNDDDSIQNETNANGCFPIGSFF